MDDREAKLITGESEVEKATRCVLEHIVGNGNERVFFAKHAAVFTNERQAVDIRVNNETNVVVSLTHEIADV